MMNDPLLPPPPPPTSRSSVKTASTNKKKIKKPATSAKILVTGLSATAVLGMASGYALAGKAPTPEIVNTNVGKTDSTSAGQVQSQGIPSIAGNTVSPAVTAPANTSAAPVVTNPPVVEVPVPQATPATPGNSNGGWQQQQSSGSR